MMTKLLGPWTLYSSVTRNYLTRFSASSYLQKQWPQSRGFHRLVFLVAAFLALVLSHCLLDQDIELLEELLQLLFVFWVAAHSALHHWWVDPDGLTRLTPGQTIITHHSQVWVWVESNVLWPTHPALHHLQQKNRPWELWLESQSSILLSLVMSTLFLCRLPWLLWQHKFSVSRQVSAAWRTAQARDTRVFPSHQTVHAHLEHGTRHGGGGNLIVFYSR